MSTPVGAGVCHFYELKIFKAAYAIRLDFSRCAAIAKTHRQNRGDGRVIESTFRGFPIGQYRLASSVVAGEQARVGVGGHHVLTMLAHAISGGIIFTLGISRRMSFNFTFAIASSRCPTVRACVTLRNQLENPCVKPICTWLIAPRHPPALVAHARLTCPPLGAHPPSRSSTLARWSTRESSERVSHPSTVRARHCFSDDGENGYSETDLP